MRVVSLKTAMMLVDIGVIMKNVRQYQFVYSRRIDHSTGTASDEYELMPKTEYDGSASRGMFQAFSSDDLIGNMETSFKITKTENGYAVDISGTSSKNWSGPFKYSFSNEVLAEALGEAISVIHALRVISEPKVKVDYANYANVPSFELCKAIADSSWPILRKNPGHGATYWTSDSSGKYVTYLEKGYSMNVNEDYVLAPTVDELFEALPVGYLLVNAGGWVEPLEPAEKLAQDYLDFINGKA